MSGPEEGRWCVLFGHLSHSSSDDDETTTTTGGSADCWNIFIRGPPVLIRAPLTRGATTLGGVSGLTISTFLFGASKAFTAISFASTNVEASWWIFRYTKYLYTARNNIFHIGHT